MKTKNAMQLKAIVKNRAKSEGALPQSLMQNYLLERILERISLSPWRDNVVIKGGMLISSLIGINKRSTKDLDTTIRGFTLSHENAEKAFREIVAIDANDDFEFEFVRTEDIREIDDYPGIRVHLLANYEKMYSPLTIDVTTGDKITPEAIEYSYPLLFDDRSISLMTYPLVTILAEKLETVIARGTTNSRPRDYYDIYMLWHTRKDYVEEAQLKTALIATTEKRDTLDMMANYEQVMKEVTADSGMQSHWSTYANRYPYVEDLQLQDACYVVIEIMRFIEW